MAGDAAGPCRSRARKSTGMYAQGAALVTEADIVRLLPGHRPNTAARVLTRTGWLAPMRSLGGEGVPALCCRAANHVGGFLEFQAGLFARPRTPACI